MLDNKYRTVSEAAEELGITVQRVRQLIAAEQLDAEKVHGRLWVIPTKELVKFGRIERPTGIHVDKRHG